MIGYLGSEHNCHWCGVSLPLGNGAPPNFCYRCGSAQQWPCDICGRRGAQGEVRVMKEATCQSCASPHVFCSACHRPRPADLNGTGIPCGDHEFDVVEVGARYPGPRGEIGGTQVASGNLGRPAWQKEVPGPIGHPALRHGVVFLAQSDGGMVALAASTGRSLDYWQSPPRLSAHQPGGDIPRLQITQRHVCRLWNGEFSAYSVVTGEMAWQQTLPGWVETVLVGESNIFLIGSGEAAAVSLDTWINDAARALPPPPAARQEGPWAVPRVAANEDRCFFFDINGQLRSAAPGEGVSTVWSEHAGCEPVWLGVGEECGFAIVDLSPRRQEERPHRILWFDPRGGKAALLDHTFRSLHAGGIIDKNRVVVFDSDQGEILEFSVDASGSETGKLSYLFQRPRAGESIRSFTGIASPDGGFDVFCLYGVSERLCHPWHMHIAPTGAKVGPTELGGRLTLDPTAGVFLLPSRDGALVGDMGEGDAGGAKIRGRSIQ